MLVLLFQPGLDEFRQAQSQLSASFFSAVDCALILAAILGITGAVRVYHHWQLGKEAITVEVSAWFFASLFMLLVSLFLRAVFGL